MLRPSSSPHAKVFVLDCCLLINPQHLLLTDENDEDETEARYTKYDSYQVCESLGFSTDELQTVFQLNGGEKSTH